MVTYGSTEGADNAIKYLDGTNNYYYTVLYPCI